MFMESLFGVSVLAFVIPIYALLLPLLVIVNFLENVSPGIEPWAANVFTEQSAKGTFIRKNPTLVKILEKEKINTKETWDKILADGGSVQDIDGLDDDTKEVFKTFKEIKPVKS